MSFDRVSKRFGATAVDGLSFAVAPGEMFGLIGPDGAGKTTSIRLLCGLLRADAGSIRIAGHDPVKAHREVTAKVGYLSQRFSLYGDLSIDENIAFFAEIHGLADYGVRRDRLLEMMQLTPFRARLADRLSGGMKQKLALACTLVHEPAVILLDEPTTGVDPVSRREFWKLLSQFLATGITIVMSTPYLDEAERCTRVALLDRGRLLALDAPDALRASLPGRSSRLSPAMSGAHEALRRTGLDAQIFGDRLHVWSTSGRPIAGGADARFGAHSRITGARHQAFARRRLHRPAAELKPDWRGLPNEKTKHCDGHDCGSCFNDGRCTRSGPIDRPAHRDEAVSRALAASHRLAETLAREQGAQAAIESRLAAERPIVSVSGGYTRTNHVDEFGVLQPMVGLRVIYPDLPDNYFTRAALQWPIYTAGRTRRARAAPPKRAGPRPRTSRWQGPIFASKSFAPTGRS